MLLEGPRHVPEIEERHLASTAIPEPQRQHGGADASADVERATTLSSRAAFAVEPVHIAMPGESTYGELVQARQRDLPRVRVAREHQRHSGEPQPIRLLPDVAQPDDREIRA